VHRFTYVLLPHYDQLQHSDVVAAAYAINAKPWVVPVPKSGGKNATSRPLVSTDSRNLVIESVKKAEDSDALVVRVYECHNTRGRASLSIARKFKRAWITDMEERRLEVLEATNGSVSFDYRPFEIVTLLLE
jgi:alpha-mannosidase